MKIIILGANGQLGKSLKKIFQKISYKFYFFNKCDLDINDHITLNKKLISIKPDIIINCSAYTAVDKAEKNYEEANNVNNIAVGKLAQQCMNHNCFLIHISTDYVFDGLSKNPYEENDKKNPIGVYGKTKLNGENKIIDSGCKFCIIRTSWIFSEFGNNFLKTILKLASKNDELSVISDQVSSPTYSDDISQTILTILPLVKNETIKNEIFHYSGNTFCSWYEFAKIIIEVAIEKNFLKKKPKLKSITTSQYSSLAKRPLNSSLSSKKIFKQVNIEHSDLKKNIENVIMILKKKRYIKF